MRFGGAFNPSESAKAVMGLGHARRVTGGCIAALGLTEGERASERLYV